MKAGEFFDSRLVPPPSYARLWREAWSLLTYRPPEPPVGSLGDGEIVLVIPAFLTTDAITSALRGYLERCGDSAFGWWLGINWDRRRGCWRASGRGSASSRDWRTAR